MTNESAHGTGHNGGYGETYNKLLTAVALGLVVLLAIWGFAIAQVGFAAFIYPLLTLVLLAFVFTLSLTRG